MDKETLRMQMLSGVITESEYKAKLMEFDMDQFSMGNSSSPKASFEDKWNDVPNANKEVLKKSTGKEPVKIMASSKGINYVITKGSDNKFYRYSYTQAEKPGKPVGPFNSEEEAKKLNESLNEHYVAGGIVGIGAINQIPSRAKADYEDAFEHFLGERYEVKPNQERDDIKDINEEEVEEGNLGHNEIYSIEPEGRFWIVTWRTMGGKQEKVFQSEDEAREFASTLDEGKEEVEEGDNDLFTAKRFYKRTDNPRINILSHMEAINDIVMDMLETDLVKGYGPDERDNIYQEYMKFANAVQNLVK